MSKSSFYIEDFTLALDRDHPLFETIGRAFADRRPIAVTIEGHPASVVPIEIHVSTRPGPTTVRVRARS